MSAEIVIRRVVSGQPPLEVGVGRAAPLRCPGDCSRVIDGDSLELAISGSQLKIRLAEIDAPERDQPYGSEATAALEKLVQGRGVRIEVVAIDRYGRTVA